MKTNNYPSWLVSVEQAKKLKEIGFDLPCAFVLTNKDKIGFTTKGGNQYHLLEELDLNSNSKGSLVCVPAFEQVFEWFRGKGLFGYVDKLTFVKDEGVCNRFCAKGINFLVAGSFNSYEEAREVLINKLIEVYENK